MKAEDTERWEEEITELAEFLYNFKDGMSTEDIKNNLWQYFFQVYEKGRRDGREERTPEEIINELSAIDEDSGDSREFDNRVCLLLNKWKAKLKE